jgi:hypothetical protein
MWGLLIVACLCAVAATATAAWFDLVERSALARYKTDIAAASESLEQLQYHYKDTEKKASGIADHINQVRRDLGLDEHAPALSSAIDALRRDIVANGGNSRIGNVKHSAAPDLAIAHRASLFLALTTIGWAIVSGVVFVALRAQLVGWPDELDGIAAAGLGLLCIVTGALLQQRVVYLKDTSRGLQPLNPPSNRPLALAVCALAGTGLILLAVLDTAVAPLWILAVITGAGLVLLARELSLSIGLIPLLLARWFVSITFLVAQIFVGLFVLLLMVVGVGVWSLRVLAQPAVALRPVRPNGAEQALV